MTKLKDLKKHQIFLLVTLSLLLLSIIVIFILIIKTYFYYQANYPEYLNDPDLTKFGGFNFDLNIFLTIYIIPIYAVSLTFIISVYKLLKHNLKGVTKVCYIVSTSIAILTLILFMICIIKGMNNLSTGAIYMLLITGYPINLYSLILVCLPIKPENNEDLQWLS